MSWLLGISLFCLMVWATLATTIVVRCVSWREA